jgi:hypothetical protein
VTEVSRSQRQRIVALMDKERFSGVRLSTAEREELSALQRLAGISEDAPMRMVRQWAAGELSATPNTMQRSMTPQQRQVEILGMRWPKPPLSGKQAVLETLALRWPKPRLTSRQKLIETLGNRWGPV